MQIAGRADRGADLRRRLHANRIVSPRDREGLERLCRYGARPMLSLERLQVAADGRIIYPRKYPTKWGQTLLELGPLEFLEHHRPGGRIRSRGQASRSCQS